MAVLDASRPRSLCLAQRVSSRAIFVGALLILTSLFTIETAQGAAPSKLTITVTNGDGKSELSWTVPSEGATSYEARIHLNGSPVGAWFTMTVSINGTTVTWNVSRSNGNTAHYKIRAVNADGNGPESDLITVAPNIPKPTDLEVTAEGDGQVTLSWTAPKLVTVTRYEYTRDSGTTWTSAGTGTTYTVTGLDNGTTYTFSVRVVSANGNGAASDSVTATPMLSAPAAPTNLQATGGDRQVTLSWNAPSGTITGYQYSQNGGAWTSTGWTPATGTSTTRTVTNLTNGQTYTFKVRAVNSAGDGAESVSASATPQAPPPPPPPPLTDTTPPVDINAGTTETLTVQRVNRRTVTLSWDIPTALNAQTIAYEYSTNGGQTWTPTNSRNTSIIITGDGFGDLPPTQFKIRAMNETNGTRSFVIISATAIQRQRRVILECPLGWTRGSVFGNTKKALIYELKVDADTTNRTSIYQLKSIAIYVHPDETLETLDGWTLKIGTLYNQFGKEFKLTAENSVIDEHDFAHIENPEGTPIPMGMLGYIGQSLPSFDYRLYDATGVRVDFGISCYKGGGLTWRLWNTKDPRLLRVLPLGTSEESLSVQMQNLNWNTPFFRSEWTAAIMPDLPDAPAAPSQIKGNMVGTWADLKKQ